MGRSSPVCLFQPSSSARLKNGILSLHTLPHILNQRSHQLLCVAQVTWSEHADRTGSLGGSRQKNPLVPNWCFKTTCAELLSPPRWQPLWSPWEAELQWQVQMPVLSVKPFTSVGFWSHQQTSATLPPACKLGKLQCMEVWGHLHCNSDPIQVISLGISAIHLTQEAQSKLVFLDFDYL